jgi:hypothetical protein
MGRLWTEASGRTANRRIKRTLGWTGRDFKKLRRPYGSKFGTPSKRALPGLIKRLRESVLGRAARDSFHG